MLLTDENKGHALDSTDTLRKPAVNAGYSASSRRLRHLRIVHQNQHRLDQIGTVMTVMLHQYLASY